MTRRRELEEHRHKLGEIRDIMNSMKTLAYMETRKINRILENQRAMANSVNDIAVDFVNSFPETISTSMEESEKATDIYLLFGSERGFCGDFNDALLPIMEEHLSENTDQAVILLSIGHKMHTVLDSDPRVYSFIDGPSVIEEVESVLGRIIDALIKLQAMHPALSLYAIYHDQSHNFDSANNGPQILTKKLLPPFQDCINRKTSFTNPPVLNVPPADFLLELTDHYLFSTLHEILYTSLMAENTLRVQHLEGAVQHMDDKTDELSSKCNTLRQEEIIEEIEVILLSSTSYDDKQNNPLIS